MKIAIIGAGIAGIMPAYYLAKQGHCVHVYEQERYPAMRTSYANGGQVSVSNSETWNSWANVWKGIKWMLKKDAPLLIRPSLDFDKALWLTKFLYHTAANDYHRNTIKTIKLGIESRKFYNDIINEENLKFDQNYCGIMHFYKNENYFRNALLVKEMYNAYDCEWDILNQEQVYKKEPLLKTDGIIGGTWTASDWVGDIHKFCVELASVCEKKYNVIFHYNYEVTELPEADKIIIASGVGSIKLSKQLKDNLPIYPVKGYSITIETDNLPSVSLLDDEAKIVTSSLGKRLRVAGTAELAGENYDIRRDRIEPLLKWVQNNLPFIETKNYASWACLRPMTPNMMPIIKQSKNPKVYYHTGHGHLGWTISPATTQKLLNLVLQQNS